MNISAKSDSGVSLVCEACGHLQFPNYFSFLDHHFFHVRQPVVSLVKLSSTLLTKLQQKSYKINSGVARRSKNFSHVPPLKISVVKQQGAKHFQVIQKEVWKYNLFLLYLLFYMCMNNVM